MDRFLESKGGRTKVEILRIRVILRNHSIVEVDEVANYGSYSEEVSVRRTQLLE